MCSPPCYFEDSGIVYRCLADGYEDKCDGNFNSNSKACNGNPGEWVDQYWETSTHESCVPAGSATPDGWSTNLDGDAVPDANAAELCVDQAMHDFCNDLAVPEVIDPSDEAMETGNYWNLPATLVDSGLVGQLDRENAMLVMKGHIKWTLPTEQLSDAAERPDGPRGVLYDVAKDLRIGVMALNDNGALTECDAASPSTSIVSYCPATNKDGARVISQIDAGAFVDASNVENWDHYKDLTVAINDIQANSWTPLAEAMYNALGYYGQNKIPRLDETETDFKTESEDASMARPGSILVPEQSCPHYH